MLLGGLLFMNQFISNIATMEQMYFTFKEQKTFVQNAVMFKAVLVFSLTECASQCLQSSECCSADYDETTKFCRMSYNCWPSTRLKEKSTVITRGGFQDSIPHDCGDIPSDYPSGIYRISLSSYQQELSVYCDMDTAGGGWTVFQRREDGSVNFFRNWNDYKIGFGDIEHEHWLGNDNIHKILSAGDYTLRVELEDFHGNVSHAGYLSFIVRDEQSKYRLLLDGYYGNSGDSMKYHDKMPFTTYDVDNDERENQNCALDEKKGGWWYKSCSNANLNGLYNPSEGNMDAIYWRNWTSYAPLKKTTMMMKRISSG